jgi:photosystem II stability/assembly factor-like uncharacterized protein
MNHEEPKYSKHFEKPVSPDSKSRPGGTALQPAQKLREAGNTLSTVIFYLAMFIFIVALAFPHNPPAGNWYQQFFPNLGGRTIVDITFTDSLNGFAITTRLSATDTTFILRTTNKGDDWFYNYQDSGVLYTSLQFINQNTGFVGGYINKNNSFKLVKTTNAGSTWYYINAPFDVPVYDLFALNEDTIWLASSSPSGGGVYFTSNGGASWQQQFSGDNPDRIYMFNARIGFISRRVTNSSFYRTTNGGMNWIASTGESAFNDMHFVDSLTGWKSPPMKKTTNGGLNWVTQQFPIGGNLFPEATTFSNINRDTIWAGGGYKFFPGNGNKATLNFTSNGGNTWYFQLIDTSFGIPNLPFIQFINKRNGWAYSTNGKGIHTTNGGDTNFILPVHQISSEVPKEYKLFQNYPNPFNAMTKLRFQISKHGYAVIKLFDVTGREVSVIVNESLNTGEYEVIFSANDLSSGVYFYSLIIDGQLIDTKKMLLVK